MAKKKNLPTSLTCTTPLEYLSKPRFIGRLPRRDPNARWTTDRNPGLIQFVSRQNDHNNKINYEG